jgi:quercetin dioxygenase-like cupin family protein
MAETLASKRRILNIRDARWRPYTLQGQVQNDCAWANISYDEAAGEGCFLFRFDPGARSIAHEHIGFEEFLVLEGEIVDNDGTVYRRGDFVSLAPGSRHWSAAPKGAVTLALIRGGFRTLADDSETDA